MRILPGRLTLDIEAFAKHAKRRTANVDDVLLTARRNDALVLSNRRWFSDVNFVSHAYRF